MPNYTYLKYMSSQMWKEKANEVRERAKGKCEECHQANPFLEVHHITYARFGNEPLGDLKALCHTCHREADFKRYALKAGRLSKSRGKFYLKWKQNHPDHIGNRGKMPHAKRTEVVDG